jgi:hypothetical protein
MKIIETQYRGIIFRSRREARWAVFMDALGVKYEYEPEGFNFDGVCYLPDFWLPDLDCYVEIKGTSPTGTEINKAMLLWKATGKSVYIFFEPPEVPDIGTDSAFTPGDWQHWWCECPHCHLIGIEFNGRADRLGCKCPKSPHGDKGYNSDSPRLRDAYDRARSARFNR